MHELTSQEKAFEATKNHMLRWSADLYRAEAAGPYFDYAMVFFSDPTGPKNILDRTKNQDICFFLTLLTLLFKYLYCRL